jgi:hypothetical protein
MKINPRTRRTLAMILDLFYEFGFYTLTILSIYIFLS